MTVVVLGAGSWGTALAVLLARNAQDVILLGRDEEELRLMRETRENHRYLPGFNIPFNVQIENMSFDPGQTEMTVVAVPSTTVRTVLKELHGNHKLLVLAAKGLEAESGKLLRDIASEEMPRSGVGALSGPNLAIEIVRGIPTVAVAASADLEIAERIRDSFSCGSFRVSTSTDIIGVELAGALKNVLAIGGGMSDGLGFGDNTKGAFLSRGLVEMSRLGLAMSAKMDTFLGPAGVGDLFATAVSSLSRNYRAGRALGEGKSLEQALFELGQVAEGVPTAGAAVLLAKRHKVDMPVFAAVSSVIEGRLTPRVAVARLMQRNSTMSDFLDEDLKEKRGT
jgi:glycerol-3-phosphate dehydrogenase (NAD(P)+)